MLSLTCWTMHVVFCCRAAIVTVQNEQLDRFHVKDSMQQASQDIQGGRILQVSSAPHATRYYLHGRAPLRLMLRSSHAIAALSRAASASRRWLTAMNDTTTQ